MNELEFEDGPNHDDASIRILVAIASFGTKNLEYLKQVIRQYKEMPFDIDIVLNTEAHKAVDPAVEVLVGLPEENPRSLVFAHREVFAARVDDYDAFIYTEDDIGVHERQIRAFFALTADLQPDEIAGHMRYESDHDEARHLPDVHGSFHWRPESVRCRGEHIVAEFTNEHAGFYILTRDQLRRAIGSGGFLRPAHEGRLGMLESGATDLFTSCGFQKVLSISSFDDFLIHHIPNTYVGQVGHPLAAFEQQIAALSEIHGGQRRASTLVEVEPRILQRTWSKSYDEPLPADVAAALPTHAATALSIGCGWGAAESELIRRGVDVTAVPLDSVVSATAEHCGMKVVTGTLAEALNSLEGRTFDCVYVSHLLHLLDDPHEFLERCGRLVGYGGVLAVSGYNFQLAPNLAMRLLHIGEFGMTRDFERSGIRVVGPTKVRRQLGRAGFRRQSLQWFDLVPAHRFNHLRHQLGRFTRRNWVLTAHRGN